MIVLSIGSERNLFIRGSEAQNRIRDYGRLFEQLHIIVFSDLKNNYQNTQIDDNIFIYPTNHTFKIFYLYKIYKIVQKIIRNWKLDIGNSVITAQDPFEAGLVGWFLKMRFHLPLQLQIHTDIFSPYFLKESFKNKLRARLAKFLLPKADGIRVVSERIKRSLISNFQFLIPKISVLPIFVDVKKVESEKIRVDLHKKYPQYDFIILMASRLTREKNIGMAIKAFNDVGRQISGIRNPLLLIAGDGPERNKLKVQSQKLKVNNNIIFEPWSDDLISYYKTADLFLLTSNYEGYGRTVIEAMAAGLPVIMTNTGLAGDILKDNFNGLIVPVNNPDELRRGMRILMGNKEKRNDISRKSVKTVNNFPAKKDYLEKYRKSLNFGAVE